MSFALKYNGKYLKFGSYAIARPVKKPEQASLYTRQSDAEKRQSEEHYVDGHRVSGKNLELWELNFTVKEKKVDG